ncbi:MAG: hypothetical protein HGA93_04870 [Methanothrix sp.]|nr:hypothetical protein [Methanothrix sp.]
MVAFIRPPNDGPQVRRWQARRSRRATARGGDVKNGRLRDAPAASPAGRVGRRVDSKELNTLYH